MSKVFTTILFALLCVLGQAQSVWNPVYHTHHLGFGVSISLLDGSRATNAFINQCNFGHTGMGVWKANYNIFTTSALSLQMAYQYDLSRHWSLDAQLRYHYRSIEYKFFYTSPGTQGEAVVNSIQNHIQLPLFATWHFAQSKNTGLGLFASAGFAINLNLDNNPINVSPDVAEVDISTQTVNHGYCNFQLHKDFLITVGPYLALGYESRLRNGHHLATSISLTANQSRYTYELGIGPQAVENIRFPFAHNELEIGLTYFL